MEKYREDEEDEGRKVWIDRQLGIILAAEQSCVLRMVSIVFHVAAEQEAFFHR